MVLVAGRIECGGDSHSGLGGGTDGEGGGDRQYGDTYRLSWWEDNVAQVNLGIESNSPLACAPGLEHHHPIMSTLGDPGGRLERERDNSHSLGNNVYDIPVSTQKWFYSFLYHTHHDIHSLILSHPFDPS